MTLRTEHMQAYELHLSNLLPEICCVLAGNILLATGPEPTVSGVNKAYAGVFAEADYESMLTMSQY